MSKAEFLWAAKAEALDLRAIAHAGAETAWRTEAMRAHRSPRLIIVAKGQGRITVAGLTSGYGPNNLIFIPPRTMYGMEVGKTVYAQILTIPQKLEEDWPEEVVHLRLRDVIAQKDLSLLLDHLEAELRSDEISAARAAEQYCRLLAVYFERQCEQAEEDNRRGTSQARLAAAYADLVEARFRSNRGVADYAAELGVTPTHLTRVCNQTCGRSAHKILSDRLHYEARLLLRETRTPIKDIAASLGFASPAYFTRSFQAATGVTPSAFRKSKG